jgi:hypothetical protein
MQKNSMCKAMAMNEPSNDWSVINPLTLAPFTEGAGEHGTTLQLVEFRPGSKGSYPPRALAGE